MKNQQKDLSIKTVPVEIRVLLVDGKRMTKAVFDQMQITESSDLFVFKELENRFLWKGAILGWVMARTGDPGKWLIYGKDGTLKRIHESEIGIFSLKNMPIGDNDKLLRAIHTVRSSPIGIENEEGRYHEDRVRGLDSFGWNETSYSRYFKEWTEAWNIWKEAHNTWGKVDSVCSDFNSKVEELFASKNQIFISI